MNIDGIRAEKKALEEDIMNLLQQFADRCNLAVNEIKIFNTRTEHTAGKTIYHPVPVVKRIIVELEKI